MKPVIDISSWQAPTAMNYDTLSQQIDGVIIRVGIGTNKDYHFERHYQEFHSRGKKIGFYHVPVNDNPQAQADMVKAAPLARQMNMVWADVVCYQSRAGQRVHSVYGKRGYQLGIYTSKANGWNMQNETRWSSRKLWVVVYGYTAHLCRQLD